MNFESVLLAMVLSASAFGAVAAPLAEQIEQALLADTLSKSARPVSASERRIAQAVYADDGFAPRWLTNDSAHQVTPLARVAIALMGAASDKGLVPSDYRADGFAAEAARALSDEDAARFDAALTLAFIRYLSELGFGRVDPATMGFELPAQRRREVLAQSVIGALSAATSPSGSLQRAVASIEPSIPLYPRLLDALQRYRRLAAAPELPALTTPGTKISPGDRYDGMVALRAHLARHGDLVPATWVDDGHYDAATVQAAQRFQLRHGLEPDGMLDASTFEALAVPLTRRSRQIELSLERLRWLGQIPDERFVAINIPEFELWNVPARGERDKPLAMRVIVGKQLTDTPVFVDKIVAVEMQPYWNVPRSIASKELFSKLTRDATYLAREDMELLGAAGLSGPALRQALASGKARIRQKPGAKNALGKVKFVMPNRHSIYLHDTPSRQLFARSRRDFSHGCIRVQDPLTLAEFVLRGQSSWNRERVQLAIDSGKNQTVVLNTPVPVLIFYSTVNIGADGQVRFFRDLYGLDDKLAAALAAR